MSINLTRTVLNKLGGENINSLQTIVNADDLDNNDLKIIYPSYYFTLQDFMHQVLECTDNVFSVITLNIQLLNEKFDNLVPLLDILNSDKIKIDAL